MTTLSYHVQQFTNKVRVMEQTQSKKLTLTAQEAINLHLDIAALLEKIVSLNDELDTASSVENNNVNVIADGGKF